jgi:chemotaxis methyl-accepting protein methylase
MYRNLLAYFEAQEDDEIVPLLRAKLAKTSA